MYSVSALVENNRELSLSLPVIELSHCSKTERNTASALKRHIGGRTGGLGDAAPHKLGPAKGARCLFFLELPPQKLCASAVLFSGFAAHRLPAEAAYVSG